MAAATKARCKVWVTRCAATLALFNVLCNTQSAKQLPQNVSPAPTVSSTCTWGAAPWACATPTCTNAPCAPKVNATRWQNRALKVRGLPEGHGLNAATGEYVDMLATGINDPVKVTRSALLNAASIAALFLTTEAVIADKPADTADDFTADCPKTTLAPAESMSWKKPAPLMARSIGLEVVVMPPWLNCCDTAASLVPMPIHRR